MIELADLDSSQRVVVGVAAAVILVALGLLFMPVSVEWEESRGSARTLNAGEGMIVERSRSCAPAAIAALGSTSHSRLHRGTSLCTETGRARVMQGVVLGGLAVAGGWGGVRLFDGSPKPQAWSSRPTSRRSDDPSNGKDLGG